jgi:prephenate dehydratase
MVSRAPLCIVGNGRQPRVATLGDEKASTCSVTLAAEWLGSDGGTTLGFASFEQAASEVVAGSADYLLVPGAYPGMKSFIFEPRLGASDQFLGKIPPIVLVEDAEPVRPRTTRLYFHPALARLVDEVERQERRRIERIEVASNAVACHALLWDPQARALTNAAAADAYEVRVLRLLRDESTMPTVVFAAKAPNPALDLRAWFEVLQTEIAQ